MPTIYPSTTTSVCTVPITLTSDSYVTIQDTDGDPKLIIHNNSNTAYDPCIQFKVGTGAVTKFTLGVDDTDDKFKIGTTAVDTDTRFCIDGSGNIEAYGNIKISGGGIALILPEQSSAPGSPVEGMIARADGSGWDPGGWGRGVYAYYGGGWNKLG